METGKKEKVIYHLKISTVRLNSLPGKHRIVQSFDPAKKTTKYLLTNELTWEGIKIVTVYCHRWVIEEFFRNAKQLLDMEGATIRSEQGVTLSLCRNCSTPFKRTHRNETIKPLFSSEWAL